MVFSTFKALAIKLENGEHPILGPNIKLLTLFGLWPSKIQLKNTLYKIIHGLAMIFVASQFIELYFIRHDVNSALSNLSLSSLSFVCSCKTLSIVLFPSVWNNLVKNISNEELTGIASRDCKTLLIMRSYQKYARIVTYTFWNLVILTNFMLLLTPLIKFLTNYTEAFDSEDPEYPEIISSWLPFDNSKMPGYIFACIIHVLMSIQGAAIIAAYDSTVVTIMTFLKGQLKILKSKCMDIFSGREKNHRRCMLRIEECHRLHNYIVIQHSIFNSLVSPVMFVYLLLCSMTICCSVIQLNLKETTSSQKLWVVQYTIGQIAQLFIFCWHANEVLIESEEVDRAVYASDWWKADMRLRKQILLLAGKLNQPLVLYAGPFSNLSLPTFVRVMKGAYSFFTLFSQIQE